VQTVFTSPQRRAHQTASALFPDQPLIEMADLREISLGEWDGLTWPEIEHRHPELAARKLADWFAVTSPGGEPAAAIRARAHRALERIRVAPSPTAVVAHIGIHAILWELLTGASPLTFQQNYLEVITYDAVD
jgi:broad specificity phosphatase PhoE